MTRKEKKLAKRLKKQEKMTKMIEIMDSKRELFFSYVLSVSFSLALIGGTIFIATYLFAKLPKVETADIRFLNITLSIAIILISVIFVIIHNKKYSSDRRGTSGAKFLYWIDNIVISITLLISIIVLFMLLA